MPPAAASPASRSEEYWQRLYAMRDKYTPLLQATKVTVSRMSSAAGAAGDNRVIRTLDEELLPLLRSTPASPAPAFRTLADLLAAERTMVTLINRVQAVVLAARQQQQARAQQASAAPVGQQAAAAAAAAPAPVKRRADAAFLELSAAAKRRQVRSALAVCACWPSDAPSLSRASLSLPLPAPRQAPQSWRPWRRCLVLGCWTTVRLWAPCLPQVPRLVRLCCARQAACRLCPHCCLQIIPIRRRWPCLTAVRRASWAHQRLRHAQHSLAPLLRPAWRSLRRPGTRPRAALRGGKPSAPAGGGWECLMRLAASVATGCAGVAAEKLGAGSAAPLKRLCGVGSARASQPRRRFVAEPNRRCFVVSA